MLNTISNMRNYNLYLLQWLKLKSLNILNVDEDAEQITKTEQRTKDAGQMELEYNTGRM